MFCLPSPSVPLGRAVLRLWQGTAAVATAVLYRASLEAQSRRRERNRYMSDLQSPASDSALKDMPARDDHWYVPGDS